MKITLYSDGGARGNPGPAAYGIYIVNENGDLLLEHGEAIGENTNNVAEYTALLRGLERAKALGATEALCISDSKLVVMQVTRKWKIKNANLAKLCDEVRKMALQFDSVNYEHRRREDPGIGRADAMVNQALDQAGRY